MSRRMALDFDNELSPRELQLLVLATRGLTDQAIANELGISLATIATYWGRIRIKLGPLNRTELVARYLEYKSTEEIFLLLNEAAMLRRQLGSTKSEDSELIIGLNKLPDSVVIVDDSTAILYANEQFCNLTGYSQEELIGRKFTEFYPVGRSERFEAWHRGMVGDPTNPEYNSNRQVFVRHQNESLIEFNCNASMYESGQGKRIVVCGRLVT